MSDSTQPSVVEAIADGVAEAINSVSIAYSHQTSNKMQTMNRMWSVHNACEGSPFDRDEWLGQFNNREEANDLAVKLRRERAIASVHKALAAQPRDDVRELLREVGQFCRWLEGCGGMSSEEAGEYADRIDTALSQPDTDGLAGRP